MPVRQNGDSDRAETATRARHPELRVWQLILLVHGVHLAVHHHDTQPGVIGSLMALPLLAAACVWVAVRLWRDHT